MTKEEHIARAMLLGGRYNARTGYYFGMKGGPPYRVDAITLEEITLEEAAERVRATEKTGRPERPWYKHD